MTAMTSSTRAARRPGRRGGSHWWIHVVLGVGGFVMAFPFLWQIIMALSTNAQVQSVTPTFWPGELQWQNFAQVFERLPFLSQLGTSVMVTVIRTIAQIVLCTLAGYAFARMRFRGRAILLGIVLSILLVPSQVYLISQYQIVQNLGWLDTIWAISIPGAASAFGVFFLRQFFISLPLEIEEAARIDGAGDFRIFLQIVLPLARPALATLAVLSFLANWNDFLWPVYVLLSPENLTLQPGLSQLQGAYSTHFAIVMAGAVIASVPVLILFSLAQRHIVDSVASSGVKG